MKALEILYSMIDGTRKNILSNKNTYERLTFIAESIEEIEELENRSCDSCICWDNVENSKLKTISYCRFLNTGTKNSFYCNEWENKQ